MIVDASSGSLDDGAKKPSKSEVNPFTNVLAGVGLAPKQVISESNAGQQDNSSEAVSPEEDKITVPEVPKSSGSKKSSEKMPSSDNPRFPSSFSELSAPSTVPVEPPSAPSAPKKGRTSSRKGSTRSGTPTSICGNDTESTLSNISDPGFPASSEPSSIDHNMKATSKSESTVHNSVIVSSASVVVTAPASVVNNSSITTDMEQRIVPPLVISATPAGSSSSSQNNLNYTSAMSTNISIKELKNESVPAPVPQIKKPRRGRTPKAPPVAPDSPPSSPDSAIGEHSSKRRKKAVKMSETTSTSSSTFSDLNHLPVSAEVLPHANNHQENVKSEVDTLLRREMPSSFHHPQQEHPLPKAASMGNPMMSMSNYKEQQFHFRTDSPSSSSSSATKEPSTPHLTQLYLRNGMSAPQMLGNQLNPASSMAQKMTESLSAELEVHNAFALTSPTTTTTSSSSIVGVPFPHRNVSPMIKSTMAALSNSSAPVPNHLEELLERQWEQGSQFLMEQAQHYDSNDVNFLFFFHFII